MFEWSLHRFYCTVFAKFLTCLTLVVPLKEFIEKVNFETIGPEGPEALTWYWVTRS